MVKINSKTLCLFSYPALFFLLLRIQTTKHRTRAALMMNPSVRRQDQLVEPVTLVKQKIIDKFLKNIYLWTPNVCYDNTDQHWTWCQVQSHQNKIDTEKWNYSCIDSTCIQISLPHNHWDQYMCDMYNNSSDKLNYCWQHPKIEKKSQCIPHDGRV